MKRCLVFICLAVSGGIFWAGSVSAEQQKGNFEFGTEVYHYLYEEPGVMENKGMFYGIYGSYRIHEGSKGEPLTVHNLLNMFSVDARFAYGQVDYTSVLTGSQDGIDDFVFELRGITGHDFLNKEGDMRLTPYIGLGFRYLNDDSSGEQTTTGQYGYERESRYFYIPIGLEFANQFSEEFSVDINVEFDYFITGKQNSHLSDVPGINRDVTNTQKDGYGARGSVALKKRGERLDFSIEPFVRWWEIDDSDLSFIGISGPYLVFGTEPKNETLEAGVRIGIGF